MIRILAFLVLVKMVLTGKPCNDTAEQQIVNFKQKTRGPIGIMTTSAGAPIEYEDASSTLNRPLIFNEYLMDSLTHLVRERISERVVHAKGAGAFGYFEVTHDITDICKADLFSAVGKKTPVAVRFSLVVPNIGGADTTRDARGFAVKFYTEEGNFDIAGLNFPMFSIKDPILFTAFVRAQKRNPATHLTDPNMLWDFLTTNPEALHIFLLVFGDRGIPDGYRHMPGFGIHTFQVENKNGDSYFVRFHFHPDAGIKNLRSAEAMRIAGEDPDYAIRDLYNAIGCGNFPSWEVSIQVLSKEDVITAGFDVFDVTKILPLDIFPLKPVGKLVLNRNPTNNFADVEQLAFCPSNLVPGVRGGPDKLFEARRMSYRDAQNYRLGVNFNKIAVNCPFRALAAYNRDGFPPVKDSYGGIPNYYPNYFNGPRPYKDRKRVELIEIYQDDPNNFEQARAVYTNEMRKDERSRLVENIVYSLKNAISELQNRAVKLYTLIHPNLGFRVLKALQDNATEGYC